MPTFAEQLAAFAEKTQGKAHEVVREVVVETGIRLIDRSPVKTGQFADNWNYGLETRDTSTHGPTGARTINQIGELPIEAAGHIHYLSNAIPYGPALERGSSKQAPQGMVGLTELELPGIVEAAVKRANP